MNKHSMLQTPMDITSLNNALRETATQTQVALSELRIFTEHLLGIPRIEQITRGDEPITAEQQTTLRSLAERRQTGEPIAYIIGHKEFYSRTFTINNSVLIPRPETEDLVEQALEFLNTHPANTQRPLRVLDMGCGSGVIAITLALEHPNLEILATDISSEALDLAHHNALQLKAPNIRFLKSDLFEHLLNQTPALEFDLICSNPPYIQAEDPHLTEGDLRFEPQIALTDQGDGLRFYRSIAQHSPALLAPHGGLLLEHGFDQQAKVLELFQTPPYKNAEGLTDLASMPRIVRACL